jgi:hypothetical protein
MARFIYVFLFGLIVLPVGAAYAETPGVTLWGVQGLNTVPSARMDDSGTVRAGVSTLDPYANAFLGFQLAEPLYISLRQTAEVSGLTEDPIRLYPGLDLKLRLLEESAYAPAIAIGLQSAVGHKRSAGEYLTLSKRFGDFDVTAGMGWGRLGSAGHVRNPLKGVSGHFGKDRSLSSELPNEPSDWFTGDEIGFFGGVEYRTPLKGVSLVFDLGADRFTAEKNDFDYNAPAPWAFGVRYSPRDWVTAGVGIQGTDKIMARLSFQGKPGNWGLGTHKEDSLPPMRPYRTDIPLPEQARLEAEKNETILTNVMFEDTKALATLDLRPHRSTPLQMGQAMRALSNNAGPFVEAVTFEPRAYGLRGPKVSLIRKDFENAIALKQGSAEEIWKHAQFDAKAGPSENPGQPILRNHYRPENLRFLLDNDVSLAEEDSGALYRSAVIAEMDGPTFFNALHTGTSWRLNLTDNLARIAGLRPVSPLPVRSNVASFAQSTVGLDRMYAALTHSFTPELHIMGTAGYLEEMYGGAGGEILWRPYGKRYALGAESWLALKREPLTSLATGFNGDRVLSGFLNGWYEFPEEDITAYAKIGRYLAEDLGATLGLKHSFKNGAELEGFITLTDSADFDLFGGTTHAMQGLRLTIPLGSVPVIPEGSAVRVNAEPLGRDTGQSLDAPLKLYDMTQPLSAAHMAQYWQEVAE